MHYHHLIKKYIISIHIALHLVDKKAYKTGIHVNVTELLVFDHPC